MKPNMLNSSKTKKKLKANILFATPDTIDNISSKLLSTKSIFGPNGKPIKTITIQTSSMQMNKYSVNDHFKKLNSFVQFANIAQFNNNFLCNDPTSNF